MKATANGIELEYEVHGPADGAPLVLIRGLGTQMSEWPATFLDALTEAGFRLVVFDNRDVGLSQKMDADYVLGDMADDVAGLLDVIGIQQAHIFGISMGGMIAQLIAIRHPDRCLSMMSVMSGTGNPDVPTVDPEMAKKMSEQAEGRDAVIALSARNRALFGSPGYPETEATRLAAAAAAYDRCYFPEGVARQMRAVMADGSRVERLRSVSVPSFVIHGEDDPLVPLAAGHDTAQALGVDIAVVPGMGHNIPAALGPEIARLVTGFAGSASSR